jgi:RHS repeat-associated protein
VRIHAAALLALVPWAAAAHAQVLRYHHVDALGSVRALTGQGGALLARHDYYAFGEECTTGPCAGHPGAGAGSARKFTGKERDNEAGFDYFGARYYSAPLARFTGVDPVYTWRENLLDPQRWNRYAYGRNNPLRYVDPDGREIVPAEGSSDTLKVGYKTATDYLGVTPGAADVLTELNGRSEVITLREVTTLDRDAIRFDPNTNTIHWNPKAGLITTDGGTQSPAMILLHEASHALQKLKKLQQYRDDSATDDKQYDNAEDRRAIVDDESRAARLKGEGVRKDHGGELVSVRYADERPQQD